MDERKPLLQRDWVWIALLGCLLIALFHRLLFTDEIIRASDVLTQLFWSVKGIKSASFLDHLRALPDNFHVNWLPLDNGGRAGEGGGNTLNLLFYRTFILQWFPFPANIAWLAVLALFCGAAGTYFYCRNIGVSRFSSFVAGFLFAYCAENATLLNAGHIQKIETIAWAPWIFLSLEKALQSRRLYHYAITSLLLAVQFFTMHWQISFYTCLAVGAYWFFFTGARFLKERRGYGKPFGRDFVLATAMTVLFFTTAAMSFFPILNWSRQSERGGAVTSGASAGAAGEAKGISHEEGMSWSMPPEEILTFYVPGLVGFSRQEAGDVPAAGQVYYWGRMNFTQTTDYLGLLPWLLLPLPLLFRRDRLTCFFTFLMAATLVMALGKYTFVYRFMFDYLPGFATFRVPKMILFLFAFGAAVQMGRGLDILADPTADRKRLRRWLIGVGAFTAAIGLLAASLRFGSDSFLSFADGVINQPTRYQSDPSLIVDRYSNMLRESLIAFGMAAAYLALLVAWFRGRLPARYLLGGLFVLLLLDLRRVDDRFFVTVPPPVADKKDAKSDVAVFLEKNIGMYRMQPVNERDPSYYADYGLPNVSAYVTISERRYKEFLDGFSLTSPMADLINLKYVVMPQREFETEKMGLAPKYVPVFTSSAAGTVVLENRTVLPKAWLVPSVAVVIDPSERIGIMSTAPDFDPRAVALVETPPPVQMAPYRPGGGARGEATVERYEPNRIVVTTRSDENSLLVLGEKYYTSWKAAIDGRPAKIYPVDHILRGVYVPEGSHRVEFVFQSVPFMVGKYLTLASFAFIAALLVREAILRRRAAATVNNEQQTAP